MPHPVRIGCSGWVYKSWGASFAAKASRYLTHVKRLTDLARGVERYYASIAPLVEGGKLGPVFAPRNALRLRALLDA